MAGKAKVTTDGLPNGPLSQDEIGYDLVGGEMYVGSGNGTADGSTASIDAGEYRVTRNRELGWLNDATFPFSGYINMKSKTDGLYFNAAANFLASVGDLSEYINVDGEVVSLLGEELVVNGDFSDGTTGWIDARNSATLTSDKGRLKITADSSATFGTTTEISTEVGKLYQFSLYVDMGTATEYQIKIGGSFDVTGNTTIDKYMYSTGMQTVTFIATATTTFVGIISQDDNCFLYIDNVSVREIQTHSMLDKVPDVRVETSTITTASVNSGDYVVWNEEITNSFDHFDDSSNGLGTANLTSNGFELYRIDSSNRGKLSHIQNIRGK